MSEFFGDFFKVLIRNFEIEDCEFSLELVINGKTYARNIVETASA